MSTGATVVYRDSADFALVPSLVRGALGNDSDSDAGDSQADVAPGPDSCYLTRLCSKDRVQPSIMVRQTSSKQSRCASEVVDRATL